MSRFWKSKDRKTENSSAAGGRTFLSSRQLLAKARAMTGNAVDEATALDDIEKTVDSYDELGAVEPPYDPESLLNYIELGPHITPCIDAICHNVEGYGWRLVPVAEWMENLEIEEAQDAVRQALEIERWVDEQEQVLAEDEEEAPKVDSIDEPEDEGSISSPNQSEVTDEEVAAVIKEISIQMRREIFLARSWFNNCCSEMSFVRLRKAVRADYESHGWGCLEMKRDGRGRLRRLSYVPAYTVRPLKDTGNFVDVVEPDPITPLSKGREVMVKRKFRAYVQVVGSRKVYFKSPGDPRIVSRLTGKFYATMEAMRRPTDAETDPGEGPDAVPANEMLWIAQHNATTPCPPPTWIGNLLAVLGVREADETTYYYLNSSAIPPAVLMVAGGKLQKGLKERLEHKLDAELRGAKNSHKILVIEAMPVGSQSKERALMPQVSFQSLRDAQLSDSTFGGYDVRSSERIGAAFRLPPIIRGYTPANMPRATAFASVALAESQVFQPKREDSDWIFNKFVLPEIGIIYHRFVSNSPPTRSVEEISELVRSTAPQGGILPYEIQELVADALNRQPPKIKEEWTRMPMAMTLSGLGEQEPTEEGQLEFRNRLLELEKRVGMIITEELRSAGLEMDVQAHWVDPESSEGE